MYKYVNCIIIHSSQDMETTHVFLNRLLGKDVVHMYSLILFSHIKDKILPWVTTWMNTGNMLSKISQTEKVKNRMIFFFNPHLKTFFIAFRERRDREREKNQCERETSIGHLFISTPTGD